MAGRFVLTGRLKPPMNRTLMVRQAGSVFDAAHSRWKGWYMVLPGTGEEKMAEPPTWWWLSETIEAEMKLAAVPKEALEPPPAMTRKGQMLLTLNDSKSLSRARKAA